MAHWMAEQCDVRWFEEPVSSDDLTSLAEVRAGAPPPMEVAAGEYGYDLDYFRRMLGARAVDVQQADVTRCAGYTGFFKSPRAAKPFTPICQVIARRPFTFR